MLMEEENKEEEAEKKEDLKDTDTLPSEANEAPKEGSQEPAKEKEPAKKKKIIGLMGIEHDEGPPGSTHG